MLLCALDFTAALVNVFNFRTAGLLNYYASGLLETLEGGGRTFHSYQPMVQTPSGSSLILHFSFLSFSRAGNFQLRQGLQLIKPNEPAHFNHHAPNISQKPRELPLMEMGGKKKKKILLHD